MTVNSEVAMFPKMGDSLTRMPMNHCAKFDAASFILGREIHNCTNTKNKQKTVNDISTLAYRHVWIKSQLSHFLRHSV